MNQNKELKNMSEYLKSLGPNDAQCYIKKRTFATGKCLPDPYTLVAQEWEEDISTFPDIIWRDGICYRNICYRNQ